MPKRNRLPELPHDRGNYGALADNARDFLPKTPDHREIQVLRETRTRLAVQKGRAILEKVALDHRLGAHAYAARQHIAVCDEMDGLLDMPRSKRAQGYAEDIVDQHLQDLYYAIFDILRATDRQTAQLIDKDLYPQDQEDRSTWLQRVLGGSW